MPEDFRKIQEGLSAYVYGGTIIFLLLAGLFIFFLVLTLKRRKRMQRDKEKDLKDQQLRFEQALASTKLEIHEQTIKNISRELHDNIAHNLHLAILLLNSLNKLPEEHVENADAIQSKLSTVMHDIRDLAKSMDTDYISSLGLYHAVKHELDILRKTEYETELNTSETYKQLDPQKELILFRIIQEALHNIVKHARAKLIYVSIIYTNIQLEITIKDDGIGSNFSLHNKENETAGLGLLNMHDRAKIIGADFTINSSPGNGTVIKIVLPF